MSLEVNLVMHAPMLKHTSVEFSSHILMMPAASNNGTAARALQRTAMHPRPGPPYFTGVRIDPGEGGNPGWSWRYCAGYWRRCATSIYTATRGSPPSPSGTASVAVATAERKAETVKNATQITLITAATAMQRQPFGIKRLTNVVTSVPA